MFWQHYHVVVSDLGWVDADMHGGAVGLLSLDALHVHHKLLAVNLHHFAHLLAFVVATYNLQHTSTHRYKESQSGRGGSS